MFPDWCLWSGIKLDLSQSQGTKQVLDPHTIKIFPRKNGFKNDDNAVVSWDIVDQGDLCGTTRIWIQTWLVRGKRLQNEVVGFISVGLSPNKVPVLFSWLQLELPESRRKALGAFVAWRPLGRPPEGPPECHHCLCQPRPHPRGKGWRTAWYPLKRDHWRSSTSEVLLSFIF